ncbi:MAG: hypothetical protein H8E37_03035 [Planctomycetes bacterium]|nr:hypothetical protein [Planctomycetota bacterium]
MAKDIAAFCRLAMNRPSHTLNTRRENRNRVVSPNCLRDVRRGALVVSGRRCRLMPNGFFSGDGFPVVTR